jgi:hypothetical protein
MLITVQEARARTVYTPDHSAVIRCKPNNALSIWMELEEQ